MNFIIRILAQTFVTCLIFGYIIVMNVLYIFYTIRSIFISD